MYNPRQYLPISAQIDFRILSGAGFKVRIKCEDLPEIAVPPFGAQAVAFGSAKRIGCGYFLATRKAAKNQVILGVATAEMAGNSRVIEVREEYPLV